MKRKFSLFLKYTCTAIIQKCFSSVVDFDNFSVDSIFFIFYQRAEITKDVSYSISLAHQMSQVEKSPLIKIDFCVTKSKAAFLCFMYNNRFDKMPY